MRVGEGGREPKLQHPLIRHTHSPLVSEWQSSSSSHPRSIHLLGSRSSGKSQITFLSLFFIRPFTSGYKYDRVPLKLKNKVRSTLTKSTPHSSTSKFLSSHPSALLLSTTKFWKNRWPPSLFPLISQFTATLALALITLLKLLWRKLPMTILFTLSL